MKKLLIILFFAFVQNSSAQSADTCAIQMPNCITPNGDGITVFKVYSNCVILEFNLTIYDRWGSTIYKQDTIAKDNLINWDYQKSKVATGTYFYIINYRFQNDGPNANKTLKGALTLLR